VLANVASSEKSRNSGKQFPARMSTVLIVISVKAGHLLSIYSACCKLKVLRIVFPLEERKQVSYLCGAIADWYNASFHVCLLRRLMTITKWACFENAKKNKVIGRASHGSVI
jgi:hypothetical protein